MAAMSDETLLEMSAQSPQPTLKVCTRRVQQWLRSAAKEIAKSSLAWYLEMDAEPEEDRLITFADVVLRVVENMKEQKRFFEQERLNAEAAERERVRLLAERERRLRELKAEAEAEMRRKREKVLAQRRAKEQAQQKAIEDAKRRQSALAARRKAAEQKRRKRKARELRLRCEAERATSIHALEESKASVKRRREEERLRLLALKQHLLQQCQKRLKPGKFYSKERAYRGANSKPPGTFSEFGITNRSPGNSCRLPSILQTEPNRRQPVHGPAAQSKARKAKPALVKGPAAQSHSLHAQTRCSLPNISLNLPTQPKARTRRHQVLSEQVRQKAKQSSKRRRRNKSKRDHSSRKSVAANEVAVAQSAARNSVNTVRF